jgi:hypothetical protein
MGFLKSKAQIAVDGLIRNLSCALDKLGLLKRQSADT